MPLLRGEGLLLQGAAQRRDLGGRTGGIGALLHSRMTRMIPQQRPRTPLSPPEPAARQGRCGTAGRGPRLGLGRPGAQPESDLKGLRLTMRLRSSTELLLLPLCEFSSET